MSATPTRPDGKKQSTGSASRDGKLAAATTGPDTSDVSDAHAIASQRRQSAAEIKAARLADKEEEDAQKLARKQQHLDDEADILAVENAAKAEQVRAFNEAEEARLKAAKAKLEDEDAARRAKIEADLRDKKMSAEAAAAAKEALIAESAARRKEMDDASKAKLKAKEEEDALKLERKKQQLADEAAMLAAENAAKAEQVKAFNDSTR